MKVLSLLLRIVVFMVVAEKSMAQQKMKDYEKVFTKAEQPAAFPGGPSAWLAFLTQHLRYPEKAQQDGIQGIVRVMFIVDRKGRISDVVALNDPGDGLGAEAVRIIKLSPRWIPAKQNGRKVVFRHIQNMSFAIP